MPLRSTIAAKIFGLAVILVCLMMVLAGFLLWEVTLLNRQMQNITGYYQPLIRAIVDINEAGLRRRLAFERWFGELDAAISRPEELAEAMKDYGRFDVVVEAQLQSINDLLARPPAMVFGTDQLARISSELREATTTYSVVSVRQKQVLTLMKEKHRERATAVMNVLDDMQDILQEERNTMQDGMEKLMADETKEATRRYTQVFSLTIAATLTSMLLGLIFAALVTRRLVSPVRSLMMGIKNVEKGDLSVELPVESTDEVGVLTRSFNYFVGELRAKEELRSTFGKYIDPRVLERVLQNQDGAEAEGGRQDMSVAFTDLMGFTGIGEQLTPAGVVNLLNRHFTLQAEGIQKHHGVIDKFIGDAVMAFWGPPFTTEHEHPMLACRAALDQIRAIHALQKELPQLTGLRKNLPLLDIRIGISTGEVIVGNIGSENTRSYTVIGDTVNLAARLERANRFYRTHILICDATRAEAGEGIVTREIDHIMVKGKSEPSRIFEVLGTTEDISETALSLCVEFSKGLSAYRDRDWRGAESAFHSCLGIQPGDGPSEVFLERIVTLREAPPAKDWDGVWRMTTK